MKRQLTIAAASIALIAGLIVAASAQAATPRVPKTDWPACTPQRISYCIESVTVQPLGYNPVTLEWAATGVAVAPPAVPPVQEKPEGETAPTQVDPNASTAPDPQAGQPLPSSPEPLIETVAGTAASAAYTGRWTAPDWAAQGLAIYGYDGLYVRAKTANEFVNHVMVDVLPVKVSAENAVRRAELADIPGFATGLDPDLVISVKLRTEEIRAGVTLGVGLDVTVDYAVVDGKSSITITGSPVVVPIAASSRDCIGESGKAVANVRQFQAIIFLQNDTSGFGVDGISGKMYVGSNGVCEFSTPIWDANEKAMKFTVSAPHFARDGVTVNRGFYKAVVPYKDAALLWGLTNPADAVTALTASISTDSSGSQAALFNVSALNGNIIIDASGFQYSKPTITVKIKKGYKPTKAALKTIACAKGKTTTTLTGAGKALVCPKGYKTVAAKAVTITCVKGTSTKKVTGIAPKCPSGFRKK
jgi:hypothetical protein